ncbi:alpha/beta fold hydrolase [Mesorhizobium sp. NBSH29]|uniref:alpha/beta fold hydrolase n=1 Tax=Mesorhizobium sp. NBSH29 TaxID=2654249 RepID=UPI00189696B5|nr:alpha/beta hydrolase [Mesorhizobium sp. NBSH29]QPC85512.1 alpha/beta fold hydrolase [Mesorhizobium sp. NBSH29]
MWSVDQTTQTEAGIVAWGKGGSGPDLILAHGWPWSSFSWHRVIPELAKHFTCHWFDMPGYGRSEMRSGQSTALDVQGEVFAEMVSFWGLSKPRVLGHDFGGAVTLRAHLLGGVDYEKLVLMNVVVLSPWGSAFFDHVGRHVDAFTGLPPHIHEAVARAYIKGAMVNELDAGDFDQLLKPWLSEGGRASFYAQFAQADDRYTDDFGPLLNHIRCPVAILWGEDDPWIPIARGKMLHEKIPGSTFEALTGVGHLPQLEAPDRVVARLLHALQT